MMMRLLRWTSGTLLALTFAVSCAYETRAADAKPGEEGYVSLFNGKDLTGWRYGKEGLDGKMTTLDQRFEVKDGIIVANEGKGIKDLTTAKEFNGNFHLKLEFRAAPRADSGVYIRGPQLQVRDYPTVGPYKPKGFKSGDWNELDITVTSGVTVTTVNGRVLDETDSLELTVSKGKAEAKLNGKRIDPNNVQVSIGPAALCKCNGEVIEQAFRAGAKGGIGLQAEVGKFEFRNLRIKEAP